VISIESYKYRKYRESIESIESIETIESIEVSEIKQSPNQLEEIYETLGIGSDFLRECKLPVCLEPEELVNTELDFYQRPQRLTANAFTAWTAMKEAARDDGVDFFLISAFRSIDYQCQLIEKKLQAGQPLHEILQVNAAPGFSEHHTGRAVDIGTLGCDALVEEFENTSAFQWLSDEAGNHGFSLSYPRNNSYGICYEPWHWCYQVV